MTTLSRAGAACNLRLQAHDDDSFQRPGFFLARSFILQFQLTFPYFALLPIAQAASTPFRLPPRNHPIKMESWTRGGVLPDYDLDTDDEEWLDEYNSSRKATRTALLDSDALELAMSFVLGGRGAELDEMVSRRCPAHLI